MKTLPWFRMYHEALDDEKLRLLAFEDRWHFVAILCCKAKGILDDGSIELVRRKVAVKLGLAARELDEVGRRLAEVDLIDSATLQPKSWDVRQMLSDLDPTAAERQKRQREKKKASKVIAEEPIKTKQKDTVTRDASVTSRTSHANVTLTDTDTDTDKENTSTNVLCLASKTPSQQLIDLFHTKCGYLPKITVVNESRKRTLKARYTEVMREEGWTPEKTLEWFADFYEIVNQSKFLTGRAAAVNGHRVFRADWDWVHNPNNFVKIVEGKYNGG